MDHTSYEKFDGILEEHLKFIVGHYVSDSWD